MKKKKTISKISIVILLTFILFVALTISSLFYYKKLISEELVTPSIAYLDEGEGGGLASPKPKPTVTPKARPSSNYRQACYELYQNSKKTWWGKTPTSIQQFSNLSCNFSGWLWGFR